MSQFSDRTFRAAFVRLVRRELVERGKVKIPYFGTLTVEHRSAELNFHDDTHRLSPPRNEIQFELDGAGE